MNENHRRAVTSSLRLVEKRLVELRELLTGDPPSHELYYYVDDLDEEYRERTLASIERILTEVNLSAKSLGLEPTQMSLRREVGTVLSGVWVVVEGIRPRSLRGYGSLSKADERTMAEIYERFQKAQDDNSRKNR